MRYSTATMAAALMSLGLIGTEAKAGPCPYTDMVQGWYQQYLHRPADPGGLHTWVSALRSGACPNDVQASILASEEYLCQNGHTGRGFVTGLYTDVLGRTPCAQEVNDWEYRLRQVGCRKRLSLDFFAAAGPELGARAARPAVHRHADRRPVAPVAAPVVVRPLAPASYGPARGGRYDVGYRYR